MCGGGWAGRHYLWRVCTCAGACVKHACARRAHTAFTRTAAGFARSPQRAPAPLPPPPPRPAPRAARSGRRAAAGRERPAGPSCAARGGAATGPAALAGWRRRRRCWRGRRPAAARATATTAPRRPRARGPPARSTQRPRARTPRFALRPAAAARATRSLPEAAARRHPPLQARAAPCAPSWREHRQRLLGFAQVHELSSYAYTRKVD